MKNLFLFLLFPLFLFSQEEKDFYQQYDKKMSISDFINDIKYATKIGKNYYCKNCHIYYNDISDKKFLKPHEWAFGLRDAIVVENLNIDYNIWLDNLFFPQDDFRYGDRNFPLIFENCNFKDFSINFPDTTSNSLSLEFQESSLHWFQSTNLDGVKFRSSSIDFAHIFGTELDGAKTMFQAVFNKCESKYIVIKNCEWLSINSNKLIDLNINGSIEHFTLTDNIFDLDFAVTHQVTQRSNNNFTIDNAAGMRISNAEIGSFNSTRNKSQNIRSDLSPDTLIKILTDHSPFRGQIATYGDTFSFNKLNVMGWMDPQWNSLLKPGQSSILKEQLRLSDSLQIDYKSDPTFSIWNSQIESMTFDSDTIHILDVDKSIITKSIEFKNNKIISYISLSNNTIPTYNAIKLDYGILKFGFKYKSNIYYGYEKYSDVATHLSDDSFIEGIQNLISQYKQVINICNTNGYSLKTEAVYKLKDLETTQKSYDYYTDQTLNNWFNWKGNQFLKLYSDYGQNPFKALSFCFWTMLYFAGFYFFFYSEWDKIDRQFLINRFNTAVDYFSSEKRIEDFYADDHEKEMTTFNDFKTTLDKYKIDVPPMLTSIAKPIYQVSLLRYRILHFLYRKAEFMAGRKWIDLEQNEKYAIGVLTICLMTIYVIYLIIVRALNSIILSINAFSTLGFGQIPVRGFTKYLTIIEGFIGWFLLSVFIVSLLNQMMNT